MDDVWTYGYETAKREQKQDMERLAIAIRKLNEPDWDFPKGTRREEAAALMVEQSAQVVEAFK